MNVFRLQNGVFLAPVMSVPFLLFSGFFVSFDAIPVYLRWITYLSYIRYGFEGTAIATYGYNRTKLNCFQVFQEEIYLHLYLEKVSCVFKIINVNRDIFFQQYCHFRNPTTTLRELDMMDSKFELDIIALIIIFLVLRIAAFIFLRWKLISVR